MRRISKSRMQVFCTQLLFSWAVVSGATIFAGETVAEVPQKTDVVTYHYNSQRTGWNSAESVLTPASVKSDNFGQLLTIPLDEQVDAQPLIITDVMIDGVKRDIVYVATEGNWIYAIDAASGDIVHKRQLGAPVSAGRSGIILCGNNSSVIGITSTPTVDRASNSLYAVAFVLESGAPTYRLFSVDLGSLVDQTPSRIVSAATKLPDGTVYKFNPSVSRQRAALVQANGNIYAAFGSFCDHDANVSRGWLLGWNASAPLTPLPSNELVDRRSPDVPKYHLASIWMSGYGPAADELGNLFFIAGNSKPDETNGAPVFDPRTNLEESVVKMSADLGWVRAHFTPSNYASLDAKDDDFGSGGVMVIPGEQSGSIKHLAVAAGKAGQMFLLDRDNLGSFTPSDQSDGIMSVDIGRCWCGESFYTDNAGTGHVLSSGGDTLTSWKLQTGLVTSLQREWDATDPLRSDVFQKGFFTSVSSNGIAQNTAIVWSIERPSAMPPALTLMVTDAKDGSSLGEFPAGAWPNTGGAANTVPIVANGRVYVASYKELKIFGLGSNIASMTVPEGGSTSINMTVYGTVVQLEPAGFILRTRSGVVNVSTARMGYMGIIPVPGRAVMVTGTMGKNASMDAIETEHANDSPALWGKDE